MSVPAFLLAAFLLAPPPAPADPSAARPAPKAAASGPVCRPDLSVLAVKRPPGVEWFGLYLVNRKAGWLRTEVGKQVRNGREVLVARQEMVVEAKVGPGSVRRGQVDEKVYEAAPRGRLLSYRSERTGDGGNRKATLECGPTTCALTLVAEDGTQKREVKLPGETAEQADAARLAAARCGSVAGTQFEIEQLREKKVLDRYLERAVLGGAGVAVPVSVVEELEDGDRITAKVFVADDGRTLEFRYGDALVAKAEPEETARRTDVVDLFNLSRVALPGPLPRGVPMSITYTFQGLPASFHGKDERQVVAPGGAGETLLTVTARRPAADDPAKDVPRLRPDPSGGEDLEATPEVDWDHPDLRALADRVAGKTQGRWAAARKLSREVNRRLEKVYGQSRDRASEVLRTGKGDCTEHALLFVALARAAGIPAREVYGLVYANYGEGGAGLYWHAWAEVNVGDEWIPVDPTFGQDVADATHVTLGRGAKVDAVGLIGSLRVSKAEPRAL
ncbi:MAG TPA: transglutaminase-like domain-containing protein [Anaeromyxobacteraceae bacterium]|nr:transglutaminase-like domain-containing protein [Anaeromyxobacteraceae bacterium]